jgi:beta-alanine--pyruvate transaminase
VNAGHGHPRVILAIQEQAAKLDFAPTFQMAHPIAFEAASRLVDISPKGINRVFF